MNAPHWRFTPSGSWIRTTAKPGERDFLMSSSNFNFRHPSSIRFRTNFLKLSDAISLPNFSSACSMVFILCHSPRVRTFLASVFTGILSAVIILSFCSNHVTGANAGCRSRFAFRRPPARRRSVPALIWLNSVKRTVHLRSERLWFFFRLVFTAFWIESETGTLCFLRLSMLRYVSPLAPVCTGTKLSTEHGPTRRLA